MTTERANAIYDLAIDDVRKMIALAISNKPTLHKPSILAFKNILAYIGNRDRPRGKNKAEHYCDDSQEQMAAATGYNTKDTPADVCLLATHLGILKTVRKGGKNTPTRRTIDLAKLDELINSNGKHTVTIKNDSNGEHNTKSANSNGELTNSNGEYTAPPISKSNHQRTAPLSAAVRVDVTNSDALINVLEQIKQPGEQNE